MFLKTLTLRGFKSFADSTTFDFEPGVTVVVGPNGSGKSNIVDAVAWVLGAQGPRQLRSTKMDDVIFAGTARRPALGRAEVSLTIDNSSRRLPIDFTEVTVTRTLFRSGDSEYALNGAPCRLLDLQELFSDTGVGRQQHVIISQGQLDTVLSARPEDRRAVIEEAAGVLKYRRRRERAERRLEASEASLVRLQDLLREVRRQLKPLERQAEAARRHGDLAGELRQLKLHLAGRELGELDRRAAALGASTARLEAEEGALRSQLAALDEVIAAGEVLAAGSREADVSFALSRLEAVRERARGIAGLVAERRRSVAAALESAADAGVVAAREAEAAATAGELADAERRAVALSPEWERLAEEEGRLEVERGAVAERFAPEGAGEGGAAAVASPDARAGVGAPAARDVGIVRAELASARAAAGELREELARVHERAAALERRAAELTAASEEAETAGTAALAEIEGVRAADAAAARESELAAVIAAAAAGEQRLAEQAHHAAEARAETLSLALSEARARAGVEHLAGVDGVIGTLLDAVAVEPGYELAFEAAAEAALEEVLVADGAAGRRALEVLRTLPDGGAVLVATLPAARLAGAGGRAGAGGVDLLRHHVRATVPAAGPVLDWLLDGVACCQKGFEEALELALAWPGTTVVTEAGDRFAPGGWRVGAGRAGATRATLEEALASAGAAHDAAAGVAADAEAARAGAEAAAGRAEEARRRLERLEAELGRHARSRNELAEQLERVGADLAAAEALVGGIAEGAAAGGERVAALEVELAGLEAIEAEVLARLAEERRERQRVEERARALASLRADLEVRAAGLEERRRLLAARGEELRAWLERHEEGRQEAAARRASLERGATALARLARSVAAVLDRLEQCRARLAAELDRQSSASRELAERLMQARRDRSAAEQELASTRERLQRLEIDRTEVRLRRETAEQLVRHELDAEPEEARDAPCPELPAGATAHARARDIERELRALGPVNELALEELTALEERHRFLSEQMEDVRSARRELGGIVRAVDAEIASLFEAAYADVSRHFEALFERLFPGGAGRLTLTDGAAPLDGGVEVEARPAGRNAGRLSLLSGGERALVALAFLFAVFRSRPSPFYLMDEVEAALNNVNLHRFIDLVQEFRDEAQLILVSHQKRTMEVADVLYGVSMQPGGASRVVSERMADRT